jgi:hypothetical protein
MRQGAPRLIVACFLFTHFGDNREFNREFFDFRPFSAILACNRCAKSMACSKIPYETEQGIFFVEQGIFWSEQGISGKGREHREHPPANEAFTQPSNVR